VKKQDVRTGATYLAKVSGQVVPVKVVQEKWRGDQHTGWVGTNTDTGRSVYIKSAQRLRAAVTEPTVAPAPERVVQPSAQTAPPNYMRFCCSLDRILKAAQKSGDRALAEQIAGLRGQAFERYRAKDYAAAVALHDQAYRVVRGQPAPAPKATKLPVPAHAGDVGASGVSSEPVGTSAVAATPVPPTATSGGKAKKGQKTKGGQKGKPAKPAKAKPSKPAKDKPMSCLDAAAKVLADAKEPMRVGEMIEAMAKKGLWQSKAGKTPEATLYAAVIREIRDKGVDSRFEKKDRGLFIAAGK
jgi:hypothetical protein